MRQFWNKYFKQGLSIFFAIGSCLCYAASNPEGIQIYQKNMHLSAEHKQNLAADIHRYHHADNIWDSLRQEFTLPHYEDNPLVQEQIEWFLNHQDFLMHSTSRAIPYLYYISQQVKKRHLPSELVLLPIIESAYNPFAYSTAGAAGIWQMMPGTASGYGIKQNWWYDGRRDVVASTKAALNHLAYLSSFFEGNWLLAIAAYDTGEGNVLSAIRRNIRDGQSIDYWSLPLAQETREYIPRILALASIISHPERYGVEFPPVRNAPYLAQVDMETQFDLKQVAYFAGLSLTQIKQLNPGYSRPTTDPNGPFKLILPIENVQQFTENLAQSPRYHRANWIRYQIKSGDTLGTIAEQFNVAPSILQRINPSLAKNTLPVGTRLIIPRTTPPLSKTILESTDHMAVATNTHPTVTHKKSLPATISHALENMRGKYKLRPGDTLYMVRHGDTLKKIAERFHISAKTLLAVNHLPSSNVSPGKPLIIPTHVNGHTSQKYHLTAGDTIYIVRRGDTIERIAAKFHTTASAIRLVNLLHSNAVEEGDQLVIPTHV